jgi:hypothetical protein
MYVTGRGMYSFSCLSHSHNQKKGKRAAHLWQNGNQTKFFYGVAGYQERNKINLWQNRNQTKFFYGVTGYQERNKINMWPNGNQTKLFYGVAGYQERNKIK